MCQNTPPSVICSLNFPSKYLAFTSNNADPSTAGSFPVPAVPPATNIIKFPALIPTPLFIHVLVAEFHDSKSLLTFELVATNSPSKYLAFTSNNADPSTAGSFPVPAVPPATNIIKFPALIPTPLFIHVLVAEFHDSKSLLTFELVATSVSESIPVGPKYPKLTSAVVPSANNFST